MFEPEEIGKFTWSYPLPQSPHVRAGFLSLVTIHILGWRVLCCRGLSYAL